MEKACRTNNQQGEEIGKGKVYEEQACGEDMKSRSGQANTKVREAAVCHTQSEQTGKKAGLAPGR
jgi:hypothetical protein